LRRRNCKDKKHRKGTNIKRRKRIILIKIIRRIGSKKRKIQDMNRKMIKNTERKIKENPNSKATIVRCPYSTSLTNTKADTLFPFFIIS
jgi:hypothetical protein